MKNYVPIWYKICKGWKVKNMLNLYAPLNVLLEVNLVVQIKRRFLGLWKADLNVDINDIERRLSLYG